MSEQQFLEGLGKRIKEIRLQKNMSQIELATRCNFEKASMSRIEAGKSNSSSLTLKKIAQALDVSVGELFSK